MMDVAKVIEATRVQQMEAARVKMVCNFCKERVSDCECEWRREGQLPASVSHEETKLREQLVNFIESQVAHLPDALAQRGVSRTVAAQIIEVDRTILHKWHTGSVRFRASAPRLTVENLERLACLLVVLSPAPPHLPESLRLRRVAGRLQLEMSATHDRITTLEQWAKDWPAAHNGEPSMIRTNRSLVRLLIEGPHDALRLMRAEMLAAERWRTLTPTPDDLARWTRGDLRLAVGGAS